MTSDQPAVPGQPRPGSIVIAAVKDEDSFRRALTSPCRDVLLQFGSICTLPDQVADLRRAAKRALVHADLIEGLSSKEVVAEYLRNKVQADGLISSKAALLKAAGRLGLITIHRFFLIDSFSFNNLPRQYAASQADYLEIMPGCISPKILGWIREMFKKPLIASGLICEPEEALAALASGVQAISTSSYALWDLSDGRGIPPC